MDLDEGASGNTLLGSALPLAVFEQYEWVEECKPYREALIPAEILNRYAWDRVG